MALITIEPGETFSHAHDTVSTTQLVTGVVDLTFDGVTIRVTTTPVPIPANTTHVMYNAGGHLAVLRCSYGVEGSG